LKTPIYYVGTPAEVEHHARPLVEEFDVRIEDAESVLLRAQPGDVCVFYNEFHPRYRTAWEVLTRRQCPSLYAIDGVLEWRNLWEFPPGMSSLWTARPILSDKVACIGRSQSRIFESWGYADLCELVGVPRFDPLLGRGPRVRRAHEPFTILVLTAKAAGFTPDQWQRAVQSLKDLRAWFDSHAQIGATAVQPLWRIARGLEVAVQVDNALTDTTGQELAQVLLGVDAVITTPSTAMLEGMLQGVPVALLDYNNAPHLAPAAWRITAREHINQVVPQLLAPPMEKMDYQRHLLHDSLECATPALPRLCELIHKMDDLGRRRLAKGQPIAYPPQLLPRPQAEPPARCLNFDYAASFPENPQFSELDIRRLQAVVVDLQESLLSLVKQKRELVAKMQQPNEQINLELPPPLAAPVPEECPQSGGAARLSRHVLWKIQREAARLNKQIRAVLRRQKATHNADETPDSDKRRAA
jgi:hypothetical protein